MWNLHSLATTYHCLPSEVLHLEDPYLAYCVDNAVFAFGSEVDGELKSIEAKNKQEAKTKQRSVMRRWLGLPQKFRNPIATRGE